MIYSLYELVTSPESTTNVSPFVWATIVDLALLGVPFEPVYMTFTQIRDKLAKATGNDKVTVPTLHTDAGYITDTWAIARWLEKEHASNSGSLRLPSSDPNAWVMPEVAAGLRDVFRPTFFLAQDAASQAYFVKAKYGGDRAKLDSDLAALRDPAGVERIVKNAQEHLQSAEKRLVDAGGAFFAGDKPGHTDAVVYGWYLSAQYNAPVNEKVWDKAVLPRLAEWVTQMKKVSKVTVDYPPPKL